METTTVQVSKDFRKKLSRLKDKLELKSINATIQRMYNIITKHKLWEELKEVKKK